MKKCRKKMPLASNGNERGFCILDKDHASRCGNLTCYSCGTDVTAKGRLCNPCSVEYQRSMYGFKPKAHQVPGEFHIFPCGCAGYLPKHRGDSNMFATAVTSGISWGCRLLKILQGSNASARKGHYKPISPSIPHSEIRQLMEEKNCVICGESLTWVFGVGKTPHLHHDHNTGQLIGFSHAKCNFKAEQREALRKAVRIKELEAEVIQLKQSQYAALPKAA